MSGSETKPLLITQGDPAGVGLELTLKAWQHREKFALSPFALVADPSHLASLVQHLQWDVPIREVSENTILSTFDQALPVIPLNSKVRARPGHPDPATALSTLESIETSVALALAGKISGIVTNPVAKYVLLEAGFQHRGSDEFITTLVEKHLNKPVRSVLLLWSDLLSVVPVTTDVPLTDVPLCLTSELIVNTASIVAKDLVKRFGINRPRLAITGLNPHAGENGGLGTEDRDIIAPAITLLRRRNIDARGPYSADSLFHERARSGYDAALAMYHDQALIPIRTLAVDSAVNVTLGLPLVRVAPSHGTAFDIAGRGTANAYNLISAIRLAAKLVKTENIN
ncbi:4-hydroxythreonine-4-phosphate dehydrogenase PdxA [Microvirga sp. W0021]|uniref:4-hydroxythreonine-4-phosphate dehydrogenase PdxA n=1 Tax=Hohaiivirga grylli TaxID=3133970 RepID=A0ABV0BL37_9HYPH